MLVQTPNKQAALATGRAAPVPCDPSPGGSSNKLNCGFSTGPPTQGAPKQHEQPATLGPNNHSHQHGTQNAGKPTENARKNGAVFQSLELQNNKEIENIVFNYTDITLTQAMQKLLNRGLNFAVMPKKLDITEMLVDYRRFERAVTWHEFWFGRNSEENKTIPIFKLKKNNMPKDHKTPLGLKIFLSSIKSEIMDPLNRNTETCNLPQDELNAMKELIKLQKERTIIIQKCDKGAGIILLTFKSYMKACYEHLMSTTLTEESYYQQIADIELDVSKKKIKEILDEGFENKIISKEELNAMDPRDQNPAKFYCIFKVHKNHVPPETPPVRPIISGSGSITENVGVFIEHHIKEISSKHKSYLKDTPHLLRIIDKINKGPTLPENSILSTTDIIGAYQNIPQNDGLECLQEVLEERQIKEIPSSYLVKLMELVQKHNLFIFHDSLWKQIIGTAMGIHPAPSYANIYLANRIDKKIEELAKIYEENNQGYLKIFKRFLDDILKIFVGTTKQLHNFLDDMNNLHPTLKFTITHTSVKNEQIENRCNCEQRDSIPYLDTLLSIENGRIEVDLYKKPTDRNQYLLPSSCHPKTTTQNLPYSSALRIIRICTNPASRDKRLEQMKELFLARSYNKDVVERAIEKAKKCQESMHSE